MIKLRNPFRKPSLAEFSRVRAAEAADMFEHHRRSVIELEDNAAWALLKAKHHEEMAAMYEARLQQRKNGK